MADHNTDPSDEEHGYVPPELLDLHVQLEVAGVTPKEFKEVYGDGDETGEQSGVEGTSS